MMKRYCLLVFLFVFQKSFAQFVPGTFTPVCDVANNQDEPHMTPDGTGGYVMVWKDLRNSPNNYANSDIYMQRFDANGNMLWASGGLPVCTAVEDQLGPKVALCKTSSGQPRLVVVWLDQRDK